MAFNCFLRRFPSPTKAGKGGREWGGGQLCEDRGRMGETGCEGEARNKK